MAFHKIDADSIDSITNAVDFFSIPPTNVTVSSSKVFEILTSNPLADTPYHFKIHSSQNYIDLSKCYLFVEAKIFQESGTDLIEVGSGVNDQVNNINGTNTDVSAIQLIGSTWIQDMKIAINGREVFNANSLMAYKTYFAHELSYPVDAKDSHLQAAGYYRDTHATLEDKDGGGFVSRKQLLLGRNGAQFISKIDADLFNVPQYLINHCEIDITIQPNESRFTIIAPGANTPKYIFSILALKLYVKKVSLMDGLALELARKLEMKPARYAVRKTMMKGLFISQGRYEFNANLFMDQVPRRLTLGLVSNSDYVGDQKRSPFNFQPFDVREISIVANGRSYPQAPYDFDFANNRAVRAFHDMNEACGYANSINSNGITYGKFLRTHCIYVFNMTNSGDDNAGLFDLIKKGCTAVSIKFSKPVPDGGLMLIVMGEADSLFFLDKNRTIASDTTI